MADLYMKLPPEQRVGLPLYLLRCYTLPGEKSTRRVATNATRGPKRCITILRGFITMIPVKGQNDFLGTGRRARRRCVFPFFTFLFLFVCSFFFFQDEGHGREWRKNASSEQCFIISLNIPKRMYVYAHMHVYFVFRFLFRSLINIMRIYKTSKATDLPALPRLFRRPLNEPVGVPSRYL